MANGDGDAKRRLAAALAVDFAGFTERVSRAGAGAADLVRDVRGLVETEIVAAGGRLEAFDGDVATARFDSAGAALGCARAVLQRVTELNGAAADPLAVRIAIHLAEFTEELGRLAGPEATLPMHIARLADAGGLILTEPVHQQLKGQVVLRGVFLPKRALRKIPWAPRLFAVPPASARYLVWAAARGGYWGRGALGLAVAAGLAVVSVSAWRSVASQPANPDQPAGPAAATERLVHSYDNAQGIFQFTGGSSSAYWDTVTDGAKGRGLRVVYRQHTTSGFWGVGTSVKQNWSGCDRLRVMLRAEPAVTLRCELVEDREERWVVDEPVGPEWRLVELPFARFSTRSDFNPGEQNGTLDLGMISVFVISTTTPGAGTLWIDELTVAGAGGP